MVVWGKRPIINKIAEHRVNKILQVSIAVFLKNTVRCFWDTGVEACECSQAGFTTTFMIKVLFSSFGTNSILRNHFISKGSTLFLLVLFRGSLVLRKYFEKNIFLIKLL